MAGYLDHYGADEQRRERTIKRVAMAVIAVVVIGATLVYFFNNYRQERQVKLFFELLGSRDYTSAYGLWGCTEAKPCRDYPMSEFMKDWGPEAVPQAGSAEVLGGDSCGSGVIVDVDAGKAGDKRIWVESDTLTLGYPPFQECPQRNRIADFLRDLKYRLHGRAYQRS
jgi:hypothetical protein